MRDNKNQRTVLLSYTAIIIMPFVIFCWMLPFVSNLTLGNDYQGFAINHQLELMFSIQSGTFPLYVPGFAQGQTASALTQGQIYHPIAYICAALPGYWEGYALEWITLFRLLSLGLVHLCLFVFLRRIDISPLPAFIISLITIYNLRMLDLFRYGAALEGWTGFLLLCTAIGSYYLKPNKTLGPVWIVLTTYLLICSGHPQMVYYGLMGAGLFTLLLPHVVVRDNVLRRHPSKNSMRFCLHTLIFCMVGLLLASAYTLPFYFDFILDNAGRVGQSYAWADGGLDTLAGTFNNFLQPLLSDVHGGFGASYLYVMCALMPLLRLFGVRLPGVIWTIWFICLLAFLHMQGSRTPVHFLAWKYLPLASSFRIAGRISMILPVLFMLLLIWAFQAPTHRLRLAGRERHIAPVVLLATLALSALFIYAPVADRLFSQATPHSAMVIRQIPDRILQISLVTGILILISLIVFIKSERWRFLGGALLCGLTIAQTMLFCYSGTWVEPKKKTVSYSDIKAEKRDGLNYFRSTGYGLHAKPIMRQAQASYLEPFMGKVYRRPLWVENNPEAYKRMAKGRQPDEVVLERRADTDQRPGGAVSARMEANRVTLIYASFNRVVFSVYAEHAGFLGLAYPFTGKWRAFIDGENLPVYRANGAYCAVNIPAGKSRIEFKYASRAAFLGMLISCAAFVLAGWLYCHIYLKGPRVIWLKGSILIAGVGVFLLWYGSLYTGEHLGTRYVWHEPELSIPANLAYGKKTEMSSMSYPLFPYLDTSGTAVDGNTRLKTGFMTGFERKPWWMVDLYQSSRIGSMILYEGYTGNDINRRSLSIHFSTDGKKWRLGRVLNKSAAARKIEVTFEKTPKARYIRIESAGPGKLSFDEIEVYPVIIGPDDNRT
jgi:hypothetical protein